MVCDCAFLWVNANSFFNCFANNSLVNFYFDLIIDAISYFLPKLIDKKLEQATINVSGRNKDYLNVISQWFSGLSELKRYLAGNKLLKVQSNASHELEKANVKQITMQQILSILNGIGALLSTIILLGVTGLLVEQKLVIFGAILSVQNFANNVAWMQETIEGLTMMLTAKPLMMDISRDAAEIAMLDNSNTEVRF